MKFMKLGSKADSFQSDGDNIRYVATELSTDIVVNVVDVKFYLHKFPLLSKSARLQKLVAMANHESQDEISIEDIPGGPAAFEVCVKYCYGMTVTLNAYNVVAARCAAEYLEMYDTVEKGNLIYKIDVFLNSSIFRGWKDSIIVLQTTKSLLPWSEELKIVSHCLDAIASKASIDTSKVEWSYTYNRKKLPSENGSEQLYNGVRKHLTVPKDWWVEDLSDLDMDLYKRVITTIKTKCKVSSDVIGEALKTYALRKLPGFSKGMVQGGDLQKNQSLVEAIVRLLPRDKGSNSSSFLLRLLRASMSLGCGEMVRTELLRRIGLQLDEASVADLLIRAPPGETTVYDIDLVENLVKEFVMQDHSIQNDSHNEIDFQELKKPVTISDASKGMVAKLVDCYLAEVSRDPNLQLSKFIGISELVSGFPRPSHDGIYRAIDMYLKEHPGISKSEKKKICKLMDCRKLSVEACAHAVQNERLPLRVVVQVLFFEQARATATSSSPGSRTPDLQRPTRALLPGGSHGSSRSATTNTEDDWDGVPTIEELKALKGEIANLRVGGGEGSSVDVPKSDAEKAAVNKVRGLLMSKRLFSKLWSSKEKDGENSSSDTSESPASTNNAEESRSTPSRNRKH
ncbi:hypothetical protein BVRB_6g128050 [Beta vulgaris subsp. vulgaris]|uniref:BTB/POZ domain-containing protein NPY4 n=1 Tax=Beta vulgaris subsp. vulgaris TaxID=3555 RepID=UPI00053FEB3D|nr:BTB/POZ domain-containing protein NPY4 [Beta vulgaris subsp. vulgaris]XP_010679622.1 BTB/POZ domain-containing protein NPY4 [Beta vulgaris subsp. vulgaris]XP_048502183.1 BTB/POZ domain-containing protein NPY4 [Beta vulgaris subsp. vulgaris]XP_048502184.1 BTB/POZ domain-containing protein NPY4 [Beta vulgaris subsp. vulgaris]KMT09829.1 hypothetical protein BVRB_6g128050 [Beta vulgaris subsp. vulgaris]